MSERLNFSAAIRLWDYDAGIILVQFINGNAAVMTIDRSNVGHFHPVLMLETHSAILHGAVNWKYGRDLICIGYGALLHVNSKECMKANLHERLLDLITPFPTWRERFEKHPLLCLQYLARDAGARFALKKKLKLNLITQRLFGEVERPEIANRLYSIEEWI